MLGTVLFLAVLAVAIAGGGLPPRSEVALWWLIPAGALATATLVLNGVEFALAARLDGHRIRPGEAIRVSAMSSAANVLPIPGAALVRIQALRRREMGTGLAVALTAGVGLVWVGVGSLLAALVVLVDGQVGAAGFLVLFGVASGGVGGALLLRGTEASPMRLVGLALFEVGATIVTALRIYAVGRALLPGFDAVSAACLAVVGILSTAAGVFPGGLGLREGLSATVAGVAALDPASAVVVAALDRVIAYVVLGAAAIALLVVRAPGGGRDAAVTRVQP